MDWQNFIEQSTDPVHLLGFLGQGIFFTRFALQWVVSERRKESVIPVGFWWCSLIGGAITLVYAFKIHSPPVALGQVFGLMVYSRNLTLVYRKRRQLRAAMADAEDTA